MKTKVNILILLMLVASIGTASANIVDDRNILQKMLASIPGAGGGTEVSVNFYCLNCPPVEIIYTGQSGMVPIKVDNAGMSINSADREAGYVMTTVSITGLDGTPWGEKTVQFPITTSYVLVGIPVTIPQNAAGQTQVNLKQVTTTGITTYTDTAIGKITQPIASGSSGGVTPTPTTTGTIKPPPPVIIPPAISALLNMIFGWISGIFPASITGGTAINTLINQPYSTQISLAFTPPDKNCDDGSCQAIFGEYFITDSAKNIKYESGWGNELISSPYTATASFTPTASGTYYLVGVVVQQQYTWSGSSWSKTETIVTKEVQQINAKLPAVTGGQPTTSASSLVSIIWDFIRGLFGLA